MNPVLIGNGNGIKKPVKKTAPTPSTADAGSHVKFQTADDVKLNGVLTRVTRHLAIFELYSPAAIPRFSEALGDFTIVMQSRPVYAGRAVVSKILDAGTKIICEVVLELVDWLDLNLMVVLEGNGLAEEFSNFLQGRQKFNALPPDFKTAVADLQLFLNDLQLWMEQAELKLAAQGDFYRDRYEEKMLQTLTPMVMQVLGSFIENFERNLPKHFFDFERAVYARRLIHPFVLIAPFIGRTFKKPLGYAGDYEMVSMMARNPFEGISLYAKILNKFFLDTPPVVAHRSRLDALGQYLKIEITRRLADGKTARIFNLGCGPAVEIQRFLRVFEFANESDFTLLDFNDETLAYTQRELLDICRRSGSDPMLRFVKKSVTQLLKGSSEFQRGSYDFVYCAGLFDYLADPVCTKLIELFYELAAPGGLVLVSNVHSINPSRGWMEYILDWHLIYRDANQLGALVPPCAKPESHVRAVGEGVNIVVEIRKPN